MIPHETCVRCLPGYNARACSLRPTATHSSLHPELVAVEVLEDRVLSSSPWRVAELDIELHSFRFELPVRLVLVVALEENSGLTTGSIVFPILIFPAEVEDHVRARKFRGNPVTFDRHFSPQFLAVPLSGLVRVGHQNSDGPDLGEHGSCDVLNG